MSLSRQSPAFDEDHTKKLLVIRLTVQQGNLKRHERVNDLFALVFITDTVIVATVSARDCQ